MVVGPSDTGTVMCLSTRAAKTRFYNMALSCCPITVRMPVNASLVSPPQFPLPSYTLDKNYPTKAFLLTSPGRFEN